MQQFIETNWLSLLSILIGILVAYIFFRLQRKDSVSASQERKKHATSELLDVVESYIINKQTLSEHVINNLIFASERDHSVKLSPSCSPISLLQDVALRLQRSRHLDIPQKSEYSLKIEELIQEVRNRAEPTPFYQLTNEIQLKLIDVEALIPDEQRDEAKKRLSSLTKVLEQQCGISTKRKESEEFTDFILPVMAGLMSVFGTTFLGTKFLNDAASPLLGSFKMLFPFFGGLVLIIILLVALLTILRIRRRSQITNQDTRRDEI
ncbi:TPA: hypothetical protein ACSP2I_003243 [Aeromonas veronii]